VLQGHHGMPVLHALHDSSVAGGEMQLSLGIFVVVVVTRLLRHLQSGGSALQGKWGKPRSHAAQSSGEAGGTTQLSGVDGDFGL